MKQLVWIAAIQIAKVHAMSLVLLPVIVLVIQDVLINVLQLAGLLVTIHARELVIVPVQVPQPQVDAHHVIIHVREHAIAPALVLVRELQPQVDVLLVIIHAREIVKDLVQAVVVLVVLLDVKELVKVNVPEGVREVV